MRLEYPRLLIGHLSRSISSKLAGSVSASGCSTKGNLIPRRRCALGCGKAASRAHALLGPESVHWREDQTDGATSAS